MQLVDKHFDWTRKNIKTFQYLIQGLSPLFLDFWSNAPSPTDICPTFWNSTVSLTYIIINYLFDPKCNITIQNKFHKTSIKTFQYLIQGLSPLFHDFWSNASSPTDICPTFWNCSVLNLHYNKLFIWSQMQHHNEALSTTRWQYQSQV